MKNIPESIDDLDISIRTWNSLKFVKINTVPELLEYTEDELLTFRNIGKKSLYELIEELSNYGVKLKQ